MIFNFVFFFKIVLFTMFTMFLWGESSVGGVCSCCLFIQGCGVWGGACVHVYAVSLYVGCFAMGSERIFACVL